SPVPLTLVSPLDGGRHCSLDQVFAQRTSGTRHYETTVAVLDQAAPAFSLIRLTRGPLFFCTNDQNSSICTWLKCRSLASTCVRAAAWVAARHAPLANRLIFVSGDLFGRPRRITTNRVCATSAAGVFSPSIGVPCVSPKYVLPRRQE